MDKELKESLDYIIKLTLDLKYIEEYKTKIRRELYELNNKLKRNY